jgi:phenylacetate-CoA ligase
MTSRAASEPGGDSLSRDVCGLDSIRDREIETVSADHVAAVANHAWRRLAAGIEERSGFYRAKFAAAGVSAASIPDLAGIGRLPFTTKDEIRETQQAEPPFGAHLGVRPSEVKRVYQTSGSSGSPSVIALTAADCETWTTIGARTYWTTGVHPHNSVLTTFGAGPFVAGHTHDTFERIGVRRVPVGPGDTERVLSALARGLVDTVLSTPSFALHLASVFDARDMDGPSLGVRHLAVGGEPGGGIPAIRRRIEEAFGADVTEAGGIGDISPSLWGECPLKVGMHFCGQGLVWPELIDPVTGETIVIEPGAVGEIVYTTLVREAMPLIRFRSKDVVEIVGVGCGCGRSGFRMRITGRSDDMFIVRGVNVYPSAIQAVVAEFEPLTTGRCRVVLPASAGVSVEPPINVDVEIPEGSEPPPSLVDDIERSIRSKLIFRAAVSLVPESAFGEAGYKTPPIIRR